MKNRLITLLLLLILLGCSNFDRISLGAGYGEYTGSVDFVFNKDKSQSSGGIVFDRITKEGTEPLFSFDQEQIEKLFEKLKEKAGDVGILEVSEKSKYAKILEVLKNDSASSD